MRYTLLFLLLLPSLSFAQPQVGADRIRKDNLTIITTATGNAIMCGTLNKIATKFDVCSIVTGKQ